MSLVTGLRPDGIARYHVFIASPGDVKAEREAVRAFFEKYNTSFAELRGVHFEIVEWNTHATAGYGRPQARITQETLERYRDSLALVIGILGQRFGSPSGTHDSGTEEEFEWTVKSRTESKFPEFKLFFKDAKTVTFSADNADADLAQWKKVKAFRERVDAGKTVLFRTYTDPADFVKLLDEDVGRWLNDPARPWSNPAAPAASPSRPTQEWPDDVLARISQEHADNFGAHMRGGEQIALDDARRRYVQALICLRPPTSNYIGDESATGREGPLGDFFSAGHHLLVIGPGGLGKTTMLKQAAAEGGLRSTSHPESPVFVYLRLGGVDTADGPLDGLFTALSQTAHIERDAFERSWRGGSRPIVLLLDGINEVQTSVDAPFAEAVWKLLQAASARHRCVITSRPGGQLEMLATRADESHRLRLADLREFGENQVDEYLTAQGRSELRERFSEPIRALTANPFLLWAITRTLAMSPDIRNRGSLFQALIDRYIFETREQSKRPHPPTDYNYQLVKKPVLAALALKMVDEGVTDLGHRDALTPVSGQLLEVAKLGDNRLQPFEAVTFMPRDYSAATLVRECLDNGVLILEGDKLRFMHESVQEYFAASALSIGPVDEIQHRLPAVNLAQIDARGPMFETAVTWAGLGGPDRVGQVVTAITKSHPLLAAALAAEAELPSFKVRPLREHLLSLTHSEHEQRLKLALLGLKTIPSDDPAVVDRLIQLVHEGRESYSASGVLKAAPTPSMIGSVVKSWLATPGEDLDTDDRVDLLSGLVKSHGRVIAEFLVNLWIAEHDDRLVRLAAALNAGVGLVFHTQNIIHDLLVTLSTEAEVAGNTERSAAIDAFRYHTKQVETPGRKWFETFSARIERITELQREMERATELIGSQSDDVLEGILRDGAPAERRVALDTLSARGAVAAIGPAVDAALGDGDLAAPFARLQKLPRALVQERLTEVVAIRGPALRGRARLIETLMADRPDPAEIERIFDSQSEDVRTIAAKAAERSLPEATQVLQRQLGREAAGSVIKALIRTLASSHESAALEQLLRLLFDRGGRSTWVGRHVELIKDGNHSIGDDGWGNVIHDALANDPAATLDRAEQMLHSGDADAATEAVHELRRWLPTSRAIALLREAMSHSNIEVARWAKWSMASIGDPEGWRLLIQAELDTPPNFVGVAQDAARRFGEMPLDASLRTRLVATAEQVLRPELQSADATRRAQVIELTARMPDGWVTGDWQRDVIEAAQQLLQTQERDDRRLALRSLLRFTSDGEARLLDVVLTDSSERVVGVAYSLLGDRAHERLGLELQEAVKSADGAKAGRVATLVKQLATDDETKEVEERVVSFLDSTEAGQAAAALMVIAKLHASDDEADDAMALMTQVRVAFERHGVSTLWVAFAQSASSILESERGFIYRLLWGFCARPADHNQLLLLAEELWPTDLEIFGMQVVADVERGDQEGANRRLDAFAAKFTDRISSSWLGARYGDLGRYADAVTHYRRAVSNNQEDENAHFSMGWYAFLTGDYEVSIAATRQALKLKPIWPSGEFNLGIALFAANDVTAAEAAFKRGVALAKRSPAQEARMALEEALKDFTHLTDVRENTADAVKRVRQRLEEELNRRS